MLPSWNKPAGPAQLLDWQIVRLRGLQREACPASR
jgi:hypothetical protein